MGVQLNLSNGTFLMLKNEIDWNFHRFNPGIVKNSQNLKEFDWWCSWIKEEFDFTKPFHYLEIGSYAGESLFYLSQIFPKGSVITLVDLGDNQAAREILITKTIPWVREKFGHQIHLLSGDARDPEVINQIKAFAPQGRYDLVFIDANHNFEYAIEDFKNYRDKADWIAFHDISKFNTEKTKLKYKVYQANANHIWEVIKLMIPQNEKVITEGPGKVFETWTNWLEFVDNNNNPVGIPGTLKTRGIGVVRSAW
jgi:hypothetical protein